MVNERGAFRVREIADRWGCSVSKVHAMVRAGTLPSLDLAGMVRIPAADLYAYEARCRRVAPEPQAVAAKPTSTAADRAVANLRAERLQRRWIRARA